MDLQLTIFQEIYFRRSGIVDPLLTSSRQKIRNPIIRLHRRLFLPSRGLIHRPYTFCSVRITLPLHYIKIAGYRKWKADNSRTPESDDETVYECSEDDAYYNQIEAFVGDVMRLGGERGRVLSPFADAFKTYEVTWRIRLASEGS